MAEPTSFLADLEDAVSRGTAESCLQALWHAIAACVRLASKLAPSNNGPVKIINKLAFDDSSDVAGPVLKIVIQFPAP
jgi:hypothetical protein